MFSSMFLIFIIAVSALSVTLSFSTARFMRIRSCKTTSLQMIQRYEKEVDFTYDEHLPALLNKGRAADRPDPDMARDLRARFKAIDAISKRASVALESSNKELAIELQEIADEMKETAEKFVKAAETWDAWGRPSPDLGSDLRLKQKQLKGESSDPNFLANLPDMLKKGQGPRPDYDLPSELRLMKYKNMAGVKRLAANALKTTNAELAAELDEIADEIEEAHWRFVEMSNSMKAQDDSAKSVSNR